ncbi:hypothetical protein [Sagittula sp.]|uniref:hypothetical protein n=1 Tax=Sagittula sp. TaxID=2038081 RepID=UPI0035197519
MPTMTHTDEQRKAWHAAKKTSRERRQERAMNERAAARETRGLLKWLRANLTDEGKAAYGAESRRLGGAAANVWLMKQAGY